MSETMLAGVGLSREQFYLKCTLAQEGAEAQSKGVCVFLERDICRSPMAQGVFEEVVKRERLEGIVEVDSAGTPSITSATHLTSGRKRAWPVGASISVLRGPEDLRLRTLPGVRL